MFNQQYNFTYNSGKRGYSAISKTADTKTVVSYKLIVKRQTTSYTNDVKSSVRGILKLEPRTVLSKTSNAKSNVEAFAAVMYYAKPDLNIFDMYDKRLAILSNEGTDACPFWDAIYREELNKGGTFTFTVPANHEDSKFVVAENKVAFRDKDDNLRLFVIKETEEIDGENGPLIEVYCDPEYIDELNDIVIEDKRPQDRTAEYALGQVLEDSRWQVGEVAELGTNTTNFYFMTGIEAINRILDVWGGEIRDRIEVSGNQITGRYIDILTRRGADTGKRWEIDKDIIEITRLTQSYPKTALYGRGASLETEGGGFSRLLTFEDVEWSVANGDPVDKPKGQKWVGDMDALQHYGRRMIGGRNLLLDTPGEEVEGIEFRHWNSDYYIVTDSVIDEIKKGGTYTMSVYYTHTESNNDSRFGLIFQFYTDSGFYSQYYSYDTFIESGETGWSKCTFELPDVSDIDEITGARVYIRSDNNVGSEESGKFVKYKMTKLEKGNKATDWSPAPEDVINDASYHRMGIYENGNIEDPEELLWATWNELQEQKRPFENYELDVLLYAEKAGLDHEKVRLGDTTIAIDRRFAHPIEVEERIIAYEYDVANPDDTGKVELGQFRELFSDEKRMDEMQAQLDNAQGKANHPEIDDDSFPDVKPETPTNFTADPLFKIIQLKWDYDASSYIASYELYASQTPNFNPTSDRLVWRGKTGGYAFEADTDEKWYFRLRAVNTHGTASDFTEEVSASTIKINAGYDVEPYTITDQLIAHDAKIDFAKIANVEITDAEIASVSADKIKAGDLKSVNIVSSTFTRIDSGDHEGVIERRISIDRSGIQALRTTESDHTDGVSMVNNLFTDTLTVPSPALIFHKNDDPLTEENRSGYLASDSLFGSLTLKSYYDFILSGEEIRIWGDVIEIEGELKNKKTYETAGPVEPNVYVASDGTFARATSAKKYKKFIEEADVDYTKILKIKPKSWYDIGELERNGGSTEGLKRYYGGIADDFEKIGLEEYVVYNDDGEVENFRDRAWLLLIPNINDIKKDLEKVKERIVNIEEMVK